MPSRRRPRATASASGLVLDDQDRAPPHRCHSPVPGLHAARMQIRCSARSVLSRGGSSATASDRRRRLVEPADHPLDDPAGDVLGGQPDLRPAPRRPGAVLEEPLRDAESRMRHVDTRRRAARRPTRQPKPPCRPPSSTVTTSRCRAASSTSAGGTGITQRGSTTVTPMPWSASRLRGRHGERGERADSDQQHVVAVGRQRARPARRRRPTALQRRHVPRSTGVLGKRSTVGPSSTATASASSSRSVAASRGAASRMPGTMPRIARSHMPLWLAPSSPVMPARSSTTVTGSAVQRDVHQQLVERPVEEGGVQRDHRVQAARGQPGRRGQRVLLGDADVEAAVREPPGERAQAGRVAASRR